MINDSKPQRISQFIFGLILTLGFMASSHADEPKILRKRSELSEATQQTHYRLPHAKVAWADFDLLRRDFKQLRFLSNHQIEEWILRNFAFISEMQLRLRGIRTNNFEVITETHIQAYHPKNYFRASVQEVSDGHQIEAYVDLKGSGSSYEPKVQTQIDLYEKAKARNDLAGIIQVMQRDHSDGLSSLGEDIAETSKQRAIQALMELDGLGEETVENYFIIDAGIDILKNEHQSIPAGIVGRQSHIRGRGAPPSASVAKIFEDNHGGFQRSATRAYIDFGGAIVIHPRLKNNFEVLPGFKYGEPQGTKAWSYGHETALSFRKASRWNILEARSYVYQHLDDMLGDVGKEWLAQRRVKKFMNLWFHFYEKTIPTQGPELRAWVEMLFYAREDEGIEILQAGLKAHPTIEFNDAIDRLAKEISHNSKLPRDLARSRVITSTLVQGGAHTQLSRASLLARIESGSLDSILVSDLKKMWLTETGKRDIDFGKSVMKRFTTLNYNERLQFNKLAAETDWVHNLEIAEFIAAHYDQNRQAFSLLINDAKLDSPLIEQILIARRGDGYAATSLSLLIERRLDSGRTLPSNFNFWDYCRHKLKRWTKP